MLIERADQENLNTLLEQGKRIGYGMQKIEITWHDGLIAKWFQIEAHPGNQAPLRKDKGGNL